MVPQGLPRIEHAGNVVEVEVVVVVVVDGPVVADVLVVDVVVVLLVELDVVAVEVVAGAAGHPWITTRWMRFLWAKNVPTKSAPLFTRSEAFGAHSASRTSAFRWTVTLAPLTSNSTSQGEMVASGAGPINVELLNLTSPETLIVAADAKSSEPLRETWRLHKT